MNVIVLGARVIGSALAFEVVTAFVGAKFISNEERFTRRSKKCSPLRRSISVATAQTAPPSARNS